MMGNIRKLSGNFRIFSFFREMVFGGFWEIIGEKMRNLERRKDMVNKKIC